MERGYPLYMKIGFIFGVPFFITLTGFLAYACILGFLPENDYFAGFLMLPIVIFFGYGSYVGVLILRDINVIVIPTEEGLIVRRWKSSRHYRWSDLWRIKNSILWQVIICFDNRGKIVFAVDYEYRGLLELLSIFRRKYRTNYWGDLTERKD